MPVSWNEIRHNAIRFARDWTGAKSERAEKQTFWYEEGLFIWNPSDNFEATTDSFGFFTAAFSDDLHGIRKKEPAPVSRSGSIENKLNYFRRQRANNRDNPPKPAKANVVGSGTTVRLMSSK